jgi:hypothetical protein
MRSERLDALALPTNATKCIFKKELEWAYAGVSAQDISVQKPLAGAIVESTSGVAFLCSDSQESPVRTASNLMHVTLIRNPKFPFGIKNMHM